MPTLTRGTVKRVQSEKHKPAKDTRTGTRHKPHPKWKRRSPDFQRAPYLVQLRHIRLHCMHTKRTRHGLIHRQADTAMGLAMKRQNKPCEHLSIAPRWGKLPPALAQANAQDQPFGQKAAKRWSQSNKSWGASA